MKEWRKTRLDNLVEVKHGYAFKGKYFSDSVPGPILVTPGNFSATGGFKQTAKYYHGEHIDGFTLSAGDLIVTMTDLSKQGDTLGLPARVPAEGTYLHNQRIGLVKVTDPGNITLDFLEYALRSTEYRAYILATASGSTVRHTSPSRIGSYEILLPEITEQRAIAEVLGALDDKIAVNERIAVTAAELAEALYTRESSSTQGWTSVMLSETARWLSGGTPKTSEPSYWGGDIPWISAASLKSPWIDDSDRKVTREGAENGTRLVPKGSIIFVVRGMSLTSEFRIGLTQREVAFGQDCKALIPHAGINPATLFLAIKSMTPEILGYVDLAGHGTGRLATDRIANLSVKIPDDSAANDFAQAVVPLIDRASATKRENRTLAALRDTLLPQLVTGKLRIKDAERAVEDAV